MTSHNQLLQRRMLTAKDSSDDITELLVLLYGTNVFV